MYTIRTPLAVLFLAAFAFVAAPLSAWAQGAAVSGRVLDPQGAAVVNAEVMLSGASQPTRTVRSSGDGAFSVSAVPPGTYQLLVQAPGFGLATQDVVVGAAPLSLTVNLQVGGLTEDVTVQGALTGTAATGKTNLPIRELPMTINSVPTQVIREQAANDLVTVLQNVSGVNAFTNYGVYEYLRVPRLSRPGRTAARRCAQRREPHQHAALAHRARRRVEGAVLGALRRQRPRRHGEPDSQEAVRLPVVRRQCGVRQLVTRPRRLWRDRSSGW